MKTSFLVVAAITTSALAQSSNVSYVRTMTDGLSYPARLAGGASGVVFVTDPPSKAIVKFDAAGTRLATYPIAETPIGVAVHADGRVFVARADGKIGVYSSAMAFQGLVNPAPMTLSGPNDIAFDPTNNELYSVDSSAHQVLVFAEQSGAWVLVRAWGMEGAGLGQFTTPQSIALDVENGRVLVTDADNFRVQVFDTTGILLFKFGYRLLYTASTDIAWFARSEGMAVDACGNIYVTDALMGTLRVFSNAGKELSTTNTPKFGYGTDAGQLRAPCGLMIDSSGTLYIANTNNNSVEAYSVTCTSGEVATVGPPAPRGEMVKKTVRAGAVRQSPASTEKQMPDSPLDVLVAIHEGQYSTELDLNSDGVLDESDVDIAIEAFGMGTVEDFALMGGLTNVAEHPSLSPPHVLDIPNRCGRCHSMDGAPAGGILNFDGQANLCQSCHSAGKIAGGAWIGPISDLNSHPMGIVPDDLDPQSDLALHLDNGTMRCGTCHDPHVIDGGMDFMRYRIYDTVDVLISGFNPPADRPMQVLDPTLCEQCHADIVSQWHHVGHAEFEADPWTHYDWGMGNNWLCTGPGTPYAYCTGPYAGTVSSPANALCIAAGNPLACCTGPGAGSCTISNASCTGLGTPRPCCTGAGTGNCIANSSCTGAGVPSPCCTGVGTGTCSNALPAAMCIGAGNPNPCCTGAGAGSCSDRSSCRQCHTGNGYVDYSKDFPDGTVVGSTHSGILRAADCLVCHATHGTAQNGELLRIYDTVRLPTGQVFNNQEGGATCMACHNGRAVPPTNPSSVSTPHYLNGAAMLEGVNAVNVFPWEPGPNAACTGNAAPFSCCTGVGTGTCTNSVCTGAGVPLACCTGAGAGTCVVSNTGCTGAGTPWPCCTGAGAGSCIAVTTCTGVGTPSACCTGIGTGTCSTAFPASACTGVGTPMPCCTGAGTGPTCAANFALSNSNHTSNAGINCTTCHMAPGPSSGPEVGKVGGHSFRLVDHDTGYENVATTCASAGCHPGLTTINRTANGDYDGDGTTEGVQDETLGLKALVKKALYAAGASRLLTNEAGAVVSEEEICTGAGTPLACCTGVQTGPGCNDPDAHGANPYWTLRRCSGGSRNGLACNGTGAGTAPWDCPGGGTCNASVPTGNKTTTVINGIWNWEYVDNSGDLGVKNTGYAIGLLQIAYRGVSGTPVPGASYRYSPAP